MKKILNIILLVLMAISVVTLVLAFVMGAPEYRGVSIMLNWAYILTAIALLSAIVFPIINLVQNPQGAKRSLLGVAVVIVVVGISYVLSSADPIVLPDKTVYADAFSLRLTDAGLYTAYIALAGAFLVTIYGEIRNSFK